MTPFGKLLNDYGFDTSTQLGRALWGYASKMFAMGAEGPIFSVQSDVVFKAGFWDQVEYGIVVVKNQITYISSRGSW